MTSSSESPLLELGKIIDRLQPLSILFLGNAPPQALVAYTNQAERTLHHAQMEQPLSDLPQARYDLAIVADALEHCEKQQALLALGTLRNQLCNHICVLVEPDRQNWAAVDFFALGMKQGALFKNMERTLQLYTYDIETYNHPRSWNNPRYWANPENYGKYWW